MARPFPETPEAPPGNLASWDECMLPALEQARLAAANGEVPVGAALFDGRGNLLASAANAPITSNDPTAHAEILCLRHAAQAAGNYRLPGSILAVTLEPCIMCLGAIIHARVAGLIIGATDSKTGAIFSQLQGPRLDFVNHRFWTVSGVSADESSRVISEFFRSRRRNKNT
jgi:tRNA(adenine34) deaminase